MAQAERPAVSSTFQEGVDDYGAVRSLLERIAAALDVAIEDKWVLPGQGLSIVRPDPTLQRRHEKRLAHYAKLTVGARRARAAILPAEMLGEPGYDLMIEGYIAWSERRELSVSDVCAAAGIAPSLTLRWIALLVDQGLLDRSAGQTTAENSCISLTAKGVELATRSLEAQQAYLPAPR